MAPLALAVAGAVFGFVSDRLAVRWPEHDEEHPAGRSIGWRTIASALIGAFAFWLLADRFGGAELRMREAKAKVCTSTSATSSGFGFSTARVSARLSSAEWIGLQQA